MQEFINKAIDIGTAAGSKIILAIVVFIIGKIVIGKILKIVQKSKMISKTDVTVRSFMLNFIKVLMMKNKIRECSYYILFSM